MTPSDQQVRQSLRRDQELDTASTLTQRVRRMRRARDATSLEAWRRDGLASGLPDLANFANGLQREHAAGQAARKLPDSNGQVEGQITTLTRLKRQSYGRAKLDWLRQRMLHAA